MESPDQYSVARGSLLLFPRTKICWVSSTYAYWHMCTDRSPVGSLVHFNDIYKNQSESPFQSTWSVEERAIQNCYSKLLDSMK